MSQMKVFLSHSSQDKVFADAFAKTFRQAGADVWYDEESLGAGHLRRTIMEELAERPVFVVLLSKVALASTWVLDECEWAYDLQRGDPSRIMLPVMVAQLDWADLSVALYLRSLKRVEAGDLRPLPVGEATTQALRLLGLTAAGQAPTPATPQPSESADDLVTRGKALYAQKEYAEALPFFEVATRLAPDNFDAWANLGHVHNMLEHWQQALAAWERALSIKPNEAVALNNKGTALDGLKRYEEALTAHDRALALDPQNAVAWHNKGVTLGHLKRYEEALAAYDRALALDPLYTNAWKYKGAVLTVMSRYEEALAALDQALALDPERVGNSATWGLKGLVLAGLKRFEEALTAYDRELALDPQDATALKNKGDTLRILGREAEAQEAERRARELGG